MISLEDRIKSLLGDRTKIAMRTLKKIMTQEEFEHFIENNENFGYYRCQDCSYFVRIDLFNEINDLCDSCHSKIVKEGN